MTDLVVIGGGWAGAAYAAEFKKKFTNIEVVILEKCSQPGGLLRSETIRGHVFDIGGSHIIFSRNNKILVKILSYLNGEFIQHNRVAEILINSTYVPYPLENGLYVLPPEERYEALVNFIEAMLSRDPAWHPKTFKDWIKDLFGKWIAEKYLIPYNEKIWKRPLEEIDVDWVYTPGRLPVPDWRDVVKSAVGIPTVGYKEQSIFYYPTRGGIQTLFNKVIDTAKNLGVQVVTGFRVTELKREGEMWVINGRIRAKRIINTMPLRELTKIVDAPEEIVKASERLDYNRVLIVGVALKKNAQKKHWVYVPQRDVIFHRYAWISNYSPENSPRGESTIIAEITIPPNHEIKLDELINRTLADFEKIDVFKQNEVLFTKAWLHEYGYPIYTIGHREIRRLLMEWLSDKNITTLGRWGSWQYWNIDRIYEQISQMIYI